MFDTQFEILTAATATWPICMQQLNNQWQLTQESFANLLTRYSLHQDGLFSLSKQNRKELNL
jgi:hypothetical protein